MDVLKEALGQSVLRNVRTYIQSGNVIAESDDGEVAVGQKASSALRASEATVRPAADMRYFEYDSIVTPFIRQSIVKSC